MLYGEYILESEVKFMEELQITKEIVISLIEKGKITNVEDACKACEDVYKVILNLSNMPYQH